MKNITIKRNFGFRARMLKNSDIINSHRRKGRKFLSKQLPN